METGGFPKPASQSLVVKSRLNERSCLKGKKKKNNKESNNKDSVVNFWFLYAYSPEHILKPTHNIQGKVRDSSL